MDQCVVYGNNATFHCDTRSYEAYWEIDGDRYQHLSHYYNITNYILETSSDGNYTNITLTVITSEAERDKNQTYITCLYFEHNHVRMKTRRAQLLKMSCFGGKREVDFVMSYKHASITDCTTGEENLPDKLKVTGAVFYFNSVNETITKLQFEVCQFKHSSCLSFISL